MYDSAAHETNLKKDNGGKVQMFHKQLSVHSENTEKVVIEK